jgi:hypothetical protein
MADSNQQAYEAWLKSKSVFLRSDLVTTTKENVVAGWGCVASADIEKDTILFRVPKQACFTAAKNDDDESCDDDSTSSKTSNDPTTRDTQKDLALRFLRHKESPEWSPFLNLLTPQLLPWTLDDKLQPSLKGTELELVVKHKLIRLEEEYKSITNSWDTKLENGRACLTYREYLDACSIVASHANPWFGVSIVPFNTTLNWGKANVEFELDEDNEEVVGRAITNIEQGSELFQSYGDSVAELLYRCGFAPQFEDGAANDSISLLFDDIVSAVESLIDTQNGNTATNLESKMEALKKSGAIETSPWDGMENYLTAELSLPSSDFSKAMKNNNGRQSNGAAMSGNKRQRDDVESSQPVLSDRERCSYDDGGISKLIGICLVLLADTQAWLRTSKAIDNIPGSDNQVDEEEDLESNVSASSDDEDDNESRSDDISASVILSSLADMTPEQSINLQRLALDVGMGGHDPWRALLSQVHSSKTLKWDTAVKAAKLVIQAKLDRLNEGQVIYNALVNEHSKEKEILDAIQTLRLVEKSLLSDALDILDVTFR